MKKLLRNFILMLTVVALLCLSSCSIISDIIDNVVDDPTKNYPEEQPSDDYVDEELPSYIPLVDLSGGNSSHGYTYFTTADNSTEKIALYNSLERVYTTYDTYKDADYRKVYGNKYAYVLAEVNYSGLTTDEAIAVWKTFRDDNPLAYWFDTSVYYSGTSLYIVTDAAYARASDREVKLNRIRKTMSKYLYEARKQTTTYEQIMCLHDLIISDVDYAYNKSGQPSTEAWAHNVIGVVEKKGVVCEGYARTYQLALNLLGIDNYFVTGQGLDNYGRDAGGHAWNLVKLDGNWYWVDPTWDDGNSSDYADYTYFLNTDATFLTHHKYHTPDTAGTTSSAVNFLYTLPSRATTEYENDDIWLAGAQRKVGDITYKRSRYDGIEVIDVTKTYKSGLLFDRLQDRTLVVPESITYGTRNYAVTSIAVSAFSNRTDLTEISLPDSLLRIREQAFSDCNGITKITLGKGLEKICDYAFRGCTGIKTVNYGGSEADFAKVKIGSGNGYITSATITYGE